MLVAEKKYSYGDYDYFKEEKQEPIKKVNKRRVGKKDMLIKMSILFWVVIVSAAFILILLRYTAITEARYNVYSLNKEITKLEDNLRDAKVELESFTRSDIVEETAIKELNMQYPQYEQMVFLDIDTTPDLDLMVLEEDNFTDEESIEEQNKDKKLVDYLKLSFQKLYSLLD
ncbi:cell division protein FtsL [Wukongibacter baidiensis]|uniref:cell division protein FtsL n=1 Tax=Wukongibacter baidiensis TaxID=1723361 RepID=UPI003D7FF743